MDHKVKSHTKIKHKTTIFIVFSIATVIALFIIVGFLQAYTNAKFPLSKNQKTMAINEYIKKLPFDDSDPFITKAPSLKTIINSPIISNEDPILGNKAAPITIVQFSSFDCKYCDEQFRTLKKIIDQFSDKVKLIRKDYPESNPLSISYQGALAARCAQEQNKFWEFYNALDSTKNKLDRKLFFSISKQLNLKQQNFISCMDKSIDARILINNNIEEANALGLEGVPFVYINKQKFLGNINEDTFKKAVEIELEIINLNGFDSLIKRN